MLYEITVIVLVADTFEPSVEVDVIMDVPAETPVTSPELLTVAFAGTDDAHTTVLFDTFTG